MPLIPIVVLAALAFAAVLFVVRLLLIAALVLLAVLLVTSPAFRRLVGGALGLLPERFAFWRRRGDPSGSVNTAFEDYRRTALAKIDGEAQEFRSFLERLRRSADAADFQAFLQSRRTKRLIE